MTAIQLDYRVPPDELQSFVTLFYHFTAAIPFFEDVERADHAQLRFRLTPGPASYRFPDGTEQDAGAVHVVGPTSGAFTTRAAGPVEVIGMGLQPAGWAAMLGIDASAMLNRVIDVSLLLGESVDVALAAIRVAEGTDAKVAAAEAFVRAAIAAADTRTIEFAQRIDAWLAGSVSPQVDDLVAATGLSRRQVERRCNILYGAPPKLLARKYRALRAAVALASGSATLDSLIADGFYDQSHLIRELKQFTGVTPKQIQTEPSILAQLTIHQRRALGGKVHPIISDT